MMTVRASDQSLSNLLYSSALTRSEYAVESWSRLVSDTPLEDLPLEFRHWFPVVYLNLSHLRPDQEFPHRERLRVSYRSTYLANSRRLVHIKKLLQGFQSAGLHYALIKGMGVSLRSEYLGLRGMGDCDLLVRRCDAREVFRILKTHHYEPWSRQAKRENPYGWGPGWKSVGPWVDRQGFIVDIHVPEWEEPGLFSSALKSSSTTAKTLFLSVPDATSLALISILHGIESSGRNDRSNAIIDFVGLRKQIDHVLLVQTLSEWRMSEAAELFSTELPDVKKFLDMQFSMHRLPANLRRQSEYRTKVSAVSQILWFRRPRLNELLHLAKCTQLRRWRYLIWILLGRIAQIEHWVDRVGGFLRDASSTDTPQWCDPFEARWKLRAKVGSRIVIKRRDSAIRCQPYVVLLSGKPIGIIPWESSTQVETMMIHDVQEIAVRSVDGDRCFRDFGHEQFRVEICDD
jgi:hypothetical protein